MAAADRLDRKLERSTSTFQKASNARNALYVGAAVAAPIVKTVISASGLPGIDILSNAVESIFQVAQQISFNKKQSIRLAMEARKTFEALKNALSRKNDLLEQDQSFVSSVERFAFTLRQIEAKLKEITQQKLLAHILRYKDIADELGDLERSCQVSYNMFMMTLQVDIYGAIVQSEQAKKEDREQLYKELEAIKSSSSAIMALLMGKEGKLDQESIDALQLILHRIDNTPDKVLPAIRDFAEVATKTLKSRTNVDLPRRPPWLVSAKEFSRGERIGSGKFSVTYKATWKRSSMEVALKDLRDQETIHGLVEDIVRWRELEHPFLHNFLGAQPIGLPRFFVYKLLKNGNVLEYMKHDRLANRELLLLQISLGMEYLHRMSVVHGNLRCQNILVDDHGQALVADFGLARYFPEKHRLSKPVLSNDDPHSYHSLSLSGSLHWLAPECFDNGSHTPASDVWTFSITAFELLTGGTNPLRQFVDEDVWQELVNGYRPPRPTAVNRISDPIWRLISQCWSLSSAGRPLFPSIAITLSLSSQTSESCVTLLEELLNRWQSAGIDNEIIPQIGQVIKELLHKDTGKVNLEQRESRLILYIFRVLTLIPPVSLDELIDSGIPHAFLLVLQCRDLVGNALFSRACAVLADVLPDYRSFLHPIPHVLKTILSTLVGVFHSPPEDIDALVDVFAAIAALLRIEDATLGPASAREHLDERSFQYIVSCLASSSHPVIQESSLHLIRDLGSKEDVLKDHELRSVAPIVASLLSSTDTRVRLAALETMSRLLNAGPMQAHTLRTSVSFNVLVPLWTEWDVPTGAGPAAAEQASVLLHELSDTNDVPLLLQLLRSRISITFKEAVCRALIAIGQRIDLDKRAELARKQNIIPAFVSLLQICDPAIRPSLHEVISSYSSSDDLPNVITQLGSTDASAQDVALRMLLGIVSTMDEESKSREILASDALSRLTLILSSPDIRVVDDGSTDADADPPPLEDLVMDVLLILLSETSLEFLEDASNSMLDCDTQLALVSLLDVPSLPAQLAEKTLDVLEYFASSSDDAKVSLLQQSSFLTRLCGMIGSDRASLGCRNGGCVILRHILSIEEREEEDEEAILNANLAPSLVSHIESPVTNHELSARVLSLLIPLFHSSNSVSTGTNGMGEPEKEAIRGLERYCDGSVEYVNIIFGSRQYALLDYIRHSLPSVQLLGLKLTLALLKGSIDQRRAITTMNGFRDSIEAIAKLQPTASGTEDSEARVQLSELAKEALERWPAKARRRGG